MSTDDTRLLEEALETIEALQAQLEDRSETPHAPIAIVGMACRIPGASTLDAMRALFAEGKDAISRVPEDRWNADAYFDPRPGTPGKTCTDQGGFVDSMTAFDAAFFGISPREASAMDPQHRVMLELVWESLENAALKPSNLFGARGGVYFALSTSDFLRQHVKSGTVVDAFHGVGTAPSAAVGRAAFLLGWHGPAVAVETACSGSLVAIHQATRALRSGECDIAVAGGANAILVPDGTVYFSQVQALATDGRCKPFDARANGYVRSEGAAVVALKRLSDALADGDPIWGVIRGTAVNHDGRSAGLTTPNPTAQRMAIESALADANVDPSDVGLIEAHGTGTSLGDPIEIEALASVYGAGRSRPLFIGTAKANVGHTEAAAGVTGLVKAVLSVRHAEIPKLLHFESLNPAIDAPAALQIPATPTAWPSDLPKRAGVSSFGFAGTNAHAIVEAAPVERTPSREATDPTVGWFPVSASSAEGARRIALRLADHLRRDDTQSLSDIAYTLREHREHRSMRIAAIGATHAELADALEACADEARTAPDLAPQIAFVFPGQGGQWLKMGQALHARAEWFREHVRQCAEAMRAHGSMDVERAFTDADFDASRAPIDVIQPLIFVVQTGICKQLARLGVSPDVCVGHSMGEVAASHVAGALSLSDAAAIICKRSRLLKRVAGRGAMLSVPTDIARADALASAEPGVAVAAYNGPRAFVLSGDEPGLERIRARLAAEDIEAKFVRVEVASHSAQVDELERALMADISEVRSQRARVPFWSTVLAARAGADALGPKYWWKNLREPVKLWQTVSAIAADRPTIFVEISPHPLLTQPLSQGLEAERPGSTAVATWMRERDEQRMASEAVAALFTLGAPIGAVAADEGARRVHLPGGGFARTTFELSQSAGASALGSATGHPLLGTEILLDGPWHARECIAKLSISALPWVDDHKVLGTPVLPAAAMAEAVTRLGERRTPGWIGTLELSDFCAFAEDTESELRTRLDAASEASAHARIATRASDAEPYRTCATAEWIASGDRTCAPPELDIDDLRDECETRGSADEAYDEFDARGISYGPAFRRVERLWFGERQALGRLEESDLPNDFASRTRVLDASMHVLGALMARRGDDGSAFVPIRLHGVHLTDRLVEAFWVHASIANETSSRLRGRVTLLDEDGDVVAWIEEVEAAPLASTRLSAASAPALLHELDWRAISPLEARTPPSVLVVGPCTPWRERIVATWRGQGARVDVLDEPGDLDPDKLDDRRAVVIATDAVFEPHSAWEESTAPALRMLELAQWVLGRGLRTPPRLVLCAERPTEDAAAIHRVAPPAWACNGLMRTLANEAPELRPLSVHTPESALGHVLREIEGRLDEIEVGLDAEGAAYAPRLVPANSAGRHVSANGRRYVITTAQAGALDSLDAVEATTSPLGRGMVEIEVRAAGLNFRDVLKALASYPGERREFPELGDECSGVVTRVGEAITTIAPGDEVVAFARGAFASHVVTPVDWVWKKPAVLSFEDAATIPIAYATAHHALFDVGRAQKGDIVLIHAAAGGVGLAAVRAAQSAGCTVIATASTDEKRELLRRRGVKYVFDSRSTAFADAIRSEAFGGVDVVIGAVTGAVRQASFALLRSGGRYVELGKRELDAFTLTAARLARNLSFGVVDLDGLSVERKDKLAALMSTVLDRLSEEQYVPIPKTTWSMGEASTAFSTMARGEHSGKLVLTSGGVESVAANPTAPSFRPDRTYLITGGFGGLGRAVARWMASHGAREILATGRGVPARDALASFENDLSAHGARLHTAACDVADAKSVRELVHSIPSDRPLAGVVHAAGVLDDALVGKQSAESFDRVMRPKIAGAINLHDATLTAPLELFVLFSSGTAVLGTPGQANYAAANAFMDGLATYRRTHDLPATSIGWGPWAEVGLAAEREAAGTRVAATAVPPLKPDDALDLFARILASDTAHVLAMPIDIRRFVEFFPRASEAPLLRDLRDSRKRRPTSALRQRIEHAPSDEARRLVMDELTQLVARVLRLPPTQVSEDRPLREQGLDSLLSLELRNRVESRLGVELTSTMAFRHPTVSAIADALLEVIQAEATRTTDAAPHRH